MPYRATDDLPPRVRDHLPPHVHEIFLKAYNSAHQEYADPHKRRAGASLEETANRIAWAGVKQTFTSRPAIAGQRAVEPTVFRTRRQGEAR